MSYTIPRIILERVRADIGSQWHTGTHEDFASRVTISCGLTSHYVWCLRSLLTEAASVSRNAIGNGHQQWQPD